MRLEPSDFNPKTGSLDFPVSYENTIVILISSTMYRHKSEVIFSFPGLATKISRFGKQIYLSDLYYKKAVKAKKLRAIFHFPGSTRYSFLLYKSNQ